MSVLLKSAKNCCIFCQATFKDKYSLQRHTQTSKKCLENRPKTTYNCIWCSQTFIFKDDLNKHYKKCECDKEQLHIDLLNKHNYMIEEKDKQIRDLQDKLYTLASKDKTTVNNNGNTTYNTLNLKCGKPLILSKKRMVHMLKKTCNINYIKQGEEGLCKWFMDNGCRNKENQIALQCTDFKRGIMKYISDKEVIKQITADELLSFVNRFLIEYRKTDECKTIVNAISNICKETLDFILTQKFEEFMNPKRPFIKYILKNTYNPCIDEEDDEYSSSESDEEEYEEEYSEEINNKKINNNYVEPCFPHIWKEAKIVKHNDDDDFLYN